MFFSLITQEEPGKEVKAVLQRVTLATYEIIQHETSMIHYSLVLEFPHDLGAGYLHHKQPPSKTVAVCCEEL